MARTASSFLFLVLVCAVEVDSSQHSLQRDRDRVTELPGQPPATFRHYAGYVDLNDNNETSMFYWFFEAVEEPMCKPLVLWLNGGPGASSLLGEAVEIGPFRIRGPDSRLHLNPDSWNTVANLLFLESPAGVGFSYSNVSDVLDNDVAARNAHQFLLRWFQRFPEYRSMEFYIAGESYAGFYIPELAECIVYNNEKDRPDFINLKGIMLGNPLLNLVTDSKGVIDAAWHRGLIYENGSDEIPSLRDKIDVYNLNAKKCKPSELEYEPHHHCVTNFELEHSMYHPCFEDLANMYFNRRDVQHALHADRNNEVQYWQAIRHDFIGIWHWKTQGVLHIINELFPRKIRIWIYTGDLDAAIPITSTRYSLAELEKDGMKILTNWTPWYHKDQVGGWVVVYDRLTYLTIRGAGHLVPANAPKQALRLLTAFLKNESMVA